MLPQAFFYSLAALDGDPFAGPDFESIGPDTIYKFKLYEATTSDVVPYPGTDNVDFFYKSVVNTFAIGNKGRGMPIRAMFTLTSCCLQDKRYFCRDVYIRGHGV